MAHTPMEPKSIAAPFGRYAHGVGFASSDCIIVVTSGQLGMAVDGSVPEEVGAQADICFANITAILQEAGGVPGDVVRINAFVTDRGDFPAYMAARDRWLADVDSVPASTLVIVTGFTRPEFKVEVEVTAAVPRSRATL